MKMSLSLMLSVVAWGVWSMIPARGNEGSDRASGIVQESGVPAPSEVLQKVQEARLQAQALAEQARSLPQQATLRAALGDKGAGQTARSVNVGKRVVSRRFAARPIRTLVVSPKADDKAVNEIEEDLAVMSRLLNKEVEKEVGSDPHRAMGIAITSFSSETKAPEALFLEDHGAVFTLNVQFPLQPDTEEKDNKKPAATTDTEWEKTRKELFGGATGNAHGPMILATPTLPPAKYDPDKVDQLKQAIFNALRNAGNIRALRPQDYVTVAVLAYPAGLGEHAFAASHVRVSVTEEGQITRTVDSSTESGRQSTLTIRIRKSDVDALTQGKMTQEEFEKKAAVSIY
jgi:hypothetical protein